MGKEIKFKAYDKTNNRWFMGGAVFDLIFSGRHGEFFFDNEHPENMRDVELEWLRFTGLCDKNGREIYEGDILQYEGTKSKAFRRIVEFDLGSFGYRDLVCSWVFLENRCHQFEVIGNRWENPDLLKGGE